MVNETSEPIATGQPLPPPSPDQVPLPLEEVVIGKPIPGVGTRDTLPEGTHPDDQRPITALGVFSMKGVMQYRDRHTRWESIGADGKVITLRVNNTTRNVVEIYRGGI